MTLCQDDASLDRRQVLSNAAADTLGFVNGSLGLAAKHCFNTINVSKPVTQAPANRNASK